MTPDLFTWPVENRNQHLECETCGELHRQTAMQFLGQADGDPYWFRSFACVIDHCKAEGLLHGENTDRP